MESVVGKMSQENVWLMKENVLLMEENVLLMEEKVTSAVNLIILLDIVQITNKYRR